MATGKLTWKFLLLSLILFFPLPGWARQRFWWYCSQGNGTITTAGVQSSSSTLVMRSFPGCTATVYLAGTLTLATLYSDNASTPKSNPFVSDASGYIFFYADDSRYDVRLSGAGISTPFTLGDIQLADFASPTTAVYQPLSKTCLDGSNSVLYAHPTGYIGCVPGFTFDGTTLQSTKPATFTFPSSQGVAIKNVAGEGMVEVTTGLSTTAFSSGTVSTLPDFTVKTILDAGGIGEDPSAVRQCQRWRQVLTPGPNSQHRYSFVSYIQNFVGSVCPVGGSSMEQGYFTTEGTVGARVGLVFGAYPGTATSGNYVRCDGTKCSPGAIQTADLPAGTTPLFKVNGSNTTSQTTINFQSGTGVTVTNPSAGNVAFNIPAGTFTGKIQTAQVAPSCTTNSSSYTGCATPDTITWSVAFSDATYNVNCQGINPSDGRAGPILILTKTASAITLEPVTEGSLAISYGEVDCTAICKAGGTC